MKKTEWYPANIKPIHKGVYETRASEDEGGDCFNYWNGACWLTTICIPSQPFTHDASCIQDIEWRGLAEKP